VPCYEALPSGREQEHLGAVPVLPFGWKQNGQGRLLVLTPATGDFPPEGL
jgi:hypothetical protein